MARKKSFSKKLFSFLKKDKKKAFLFLVLIVLVGVGLYLHSCYKKGLASVAKIPEIYTQGGCWCTNADQCWAAGGNFTGSNEYCGVEGDGCCYITEGESDPSVSECPSDKCNWEGGCVNKCEFRDTREGKKQCCGNNSWESSCGECNTGAADPGAADPGAAASGVADPGAGEELSSPIEVCRAVGGVAGCSVSYVADPNYCSGNITANCTENGCIAHKDVKYNGNHYCCANTCNFPNSACHGCPGFEQPSSPIEVCRAVGGVAGCSVSYVADPYYCSRGTPDCSENSCTSYREVSYSGNHYCCANTCNFPNSACSSCSGGESSRGSEGSTNLRGSGEVNFSECIKCLTIANPILQAGCFTACGYNL
jgi:hypothetical protein